MTEPVTPATAPDPTLEEIRQTLYRIVTLIPHHTEAELHERFTLIDYLLSKGEAVLKAVE